MPTITLRFHAAARDLAGARDVRLTLDEPATLRSLGEAVALRFPRVGEHWPRFRLAVDGDFADADQALRDDAEVDVLPPVAGGSGAVTLCRVSDAPLSLDALYDAVGHAGAGGIALFVGVVRDHADGKAVARLDYEHHATLAEKEMRRVLEQVALELPGCRLAAAHRVGELAVGDRAVIVAASAPHRAEAFDACRRAIDRIKDTVPIWKKEWAPDGTAAWVNFDTP